MSNGKLEQVGTAEDLYHRPASAFAAQFMGVQNVFRADGITAGSEMRIFRPDGGQSDAALYRAPIDAFSFTAGNTASSGAPATPAKVSAIEYAGDHLSLTVDTQPGDVGLKVQMPLEAASSNPPVFDQVGTLTIKPESLVELTR